SRGRPEVHPRAEVVAAGRAMHHLDGDESRPIDWRGGAEDSRRHHRVEERQRHRRAHATHERPTVELLSGQDMHCVSKERYSAAGTRFMRNASLFTIPTMKSDILYPFASASLVMRRTVG